MKRRIISVILVIALCLSMSTVTLAAESGNTGKYQIQTPSFSLSLPKVADSTVKMELEGSEVIEIGLPSELSGIGKAIGQGAVAYGTSSDDTTLAVQTLKKPQFGDDVYSVLLSMSINNETAPRSYAFDFDLPAGYTLMTSEDFAVQYNYDASSLGSGLIYIVDDAGNIVTTIDEASARDANGNYLDTYYRVSGNTLIQYVSFNANTAFPINIAPELYATVKHKIETLTIQNTATNRDIVATEFLEKVQEADSSLAGVANMINNIFGLFSTATGVLSLIIGSRISQNQAFINDMLIMHGTVLAYLNQLENGRNKYSAVEMEFDYLGTYQGKNKGYVYQLPDVEITPIR